MKLHRDFVWVACVSAIGLLVLNIFIQTGLNNDPKVKFQLPSEEGDQAVKQRPVSIARRLSARPVADAPDIKIGLELWGTIIGSPSMAFIFNPETNQQGLFRLNDNVQDFRLVKISSGKVVLEKEGDAWELILTANNKNSSASGKPVVFFDPSSATIVVNRLQLMAQMLKAKDILGSVKIFPIPDPATSKLGGFRVDNVPAGSLIEDVGIKNGDVIYSVQGQKLQTVQDAWSMFAKVQTQSRVEVVLMRNNEPVTIKYEIK